MDRIQHYEVVRILGSGSFGYVVEAIDPGRPAPHVAIKVLHPDLAQDAEVTQRFFQEALILARLEHPAIPRVLAFGPWEGSYFLVQELVHGERLVEVLGRRRPTLAEAVAALSQLLAVLAYAHAQGVVHRDLKPHNILQTPAGLVVLDFGIAKMLGGARLTSSGSFLGSVAYAAPEQILGQEVDDRADLFSVGIIAHELLCGAVPHRPSASDLPRAVRQQIDWIMSAERSLAGAGAPEWLLRFYETCTAPHPEQRYPNAAAALAVLRRWQAA